MIIAIDFDGTVVTHDFPRVGRDIGAVPVLKRISHAGHKIILWTMRSGKELQDAVNWYKDNDIPLYGINENPSQKAWTKSPKAHANLYIDDCGLGIPTKFDMNTYREYVDWKKVEKLLEKDNII